jgi:hypothetical protein
MSSSRSTGKRHCGGRVAPPPLGAKGGGAGDPHLSWIPPTGSHRSRISAARGHVAAGLYLSHGLTAAIADVPARFHSLLGRRVRAVRLHQARRRRRVLCYHTDHVRPCCSSHVPSLHSPSMCCHCRIAAHELLVVMSHGEGGAEGSAETRRRMVETTRCRRSSAVTTSLSPMTCCGALIPDRPSLPLSSLPSLQQPQTLVFPMFGTASVPVPRPPCMP